MNHGLTNKQLLDEVFCDIQNNQGRGKGYQPKPKAENGKCTNVKNHRSRVG